MNIKLLSGALGAEITGIDLKDSSKENYKKIKEMKQPRWKKKKTDTTGWKI